MITNDEAIAAVNPIEPLMDHFRQAQTTSLICPQSAEFSNYWVPFQEMFVNVLQRNVSPEEAVATACRLMNQANGK